MSAIQDWAKQNKINLLHVQAALTNIAAGVKALDDKITQLNNSAGTFGSADQTALDDIQATSAALVAQVDAISTADPTDTTGTGTSTTGTGSTQQPPPPPPPPTAS